jgi:hypothetical protein
MTVKINIDFKAELAKRSQTILERESLKLIDALKEATPVDTGRAREGWKLQDNKIVNEVEYIEELNAGSSKQAPSHFIERTLLANENVNANGVIITPT